MYYSGDLYNFELRLHATASSSEDLSSYLAEMSGYDNVPAFMVPKWNRELHHTHNEVYGVAYNGDFITGSTTGGLPSSGYLTADSTMFTVDSTLITADQTLI